MFVVVASLMLCAGCASRMQGTCDAKEWLGRIVVAKRAAIDDVKPKYLSIVDFATLPDASKPGVLEWIDGEVRRIQAEARPGDEVWYFREEKCRGCRWYREGYALIRGCTVVDEVTLSDDM